MEDLFEHQGIGVKRLKEYRGAGYGLFYAPGGGKSRTALTFVEDDIKENADYFDNTLIVCPAFVRKTWQREWKLWGRRPLHIELMSSGKDAIACHNAHVVITSYELLKHVTWPVRRLILDEAHYVAQEKSQRSKEVRRIADLSEHTFVIALTGSPAPQEPKDLWNLLDIMNPGSFGTYWQFIRRYCNEIANDYTPSGREWRGLKQSMAADLMTRLDAVSHRVTFDEFAEHVPRMRTQALYTKGQRIKKAFDWDDPKAMDALMEMNSSAKIDMVVEKTAECMRGGVDKFCWGVWLHSTAETLAARMRALGLSVYVVNGETKSDDRQGLFDAWAADVRPSCIIVGIAAVGVGVNELVAARVAGCVEIPWRVVDLDQYMKRFERLNSTHSTMFYFFIAEGTRDEAAANAYVARKADLNAVIRPGDDDSSTREALKGVESDDEEVLRGLL